MIASFLLLAAAVQADASAPRQDCVRAPGSEIKVCGTPPMQAAETAGPSAPQGAYRVPRLARKANDPALPGAQTDLGKGVRASLRGQASNSGRGRRNKPVATVSVPF